LISFYQFFREEVQSGIRREFDIVTQGIEVWHVMEYDHYRLDTASQGQFHEGDTYVIRWHYTMTQIGRRDTSALVVFWAMAGLWFTSAINNGPNFRLKFALAAQSIGDRYPRHIITVATASGKDQSQTGLC